MNLKNYTSESPAMNSIAAIEKVLVQAGATDIMKAYENGMPTGMVFKIQFDKMHPPVVVKLPTNVGKCHEAMWREYCKHRTGRHNKTSKDFEAQAGRTAWRLLLDWVEVQVSLIELGQLDAIQAFLPFCFDGERTIYQKVQQGGFTALTAPKPEPAEPGAIDV